MSKVNWLEEEGLLKAVQEFKSLRASAAFIARSQKNQGII